MRPGADMCTLLLAAARHGRPCQCWLQLAVCMRGLHHGYVPEGCLFELRT